MELGLPISVMLISLALLSIPSVSNPDSIYHVNSLEYNGNENPGLSNPQNKAVGPQLPIENTHVEIVKSFKNSSGFYKINGTIENDDSMILTHIQVIKYYKIPSLNDTTLVCYEQTIVDCEYKSIDNQLPSKRFFLTMPPGPTT
jgi:hypothetical protein